MVEWGFRNTSESGIGPGACGLSESWENPGSPAESFFLPEEKSKTTAFKPTNASTAMTHGINAVRNGVFSELGIG